MLHGEHGMGHEMAHAPHVMHKPRHHCTDPSCAIVFVLTMVLFYVGVVVGIHNGDARRLYHGIDQQGRFCGMDPGVENKPLIYWCPNADSHVNLTRGICVADCPNLNNDVGVSVEVQINECSGEEISTRIWMDRFCVPSSDTGAGAEIGDELMNTRTQVTETLTSLVTAWPVLLGSFGASLFLGFMYLAMLQNCSQALIWLSLIAFALLLLTVGVWLWQAANEESLVDMDSGMDSSSLMVARLVSFVCLLTAFSSCVVMACCYKTYATAAKSVDAAMEVVAEVPCLYLCAGVWASIKAVVWVFLLYGFLEFFSTGDFTHSRHHMHPDFAVWQTLYLCFYFVFALWMFGVLHALFQYSVAHTVADFYFAPSDPFTHKRHVERCEFIEGVAVGASCHIGSLALGGLLQSLFHGPAMALAFILGTQKHAHKGNAVASCLMRCVQPCDNLARELIKIVDTLAYVDLAVNPESDYCIAGDLAHKNIDRWASTGAHDSAVVGMLKGSTYMFQVAGVAFITSIVGSLSYTILSYTVFAKETIWFFLPGPFVATCVCCAIAIGTANAYFDVFHMTADTLLYCYVLDRAQHTTFAPPAVQYWIGEMIEEHGFAQNHNAAH